MAICEPRKRPSADTKSAFTLITDISASRSVRNKYLLFNAPTPVYGIFLIAAETG